MGNINQLEVMEQTPSEGQIEVPDLGTWGQLTEVEIDARWRAGLSDYCSTDRRDTPAALFYIAYEKNRLAESQLRPTQVQAS